MSHSLNIYCTSYLPSLLVHLCCLWFCSVITLLNNSDVIGKWQTFNSQTFIIIVIFVDVETRQPHKHASDSYLKIGWSFMLFQCMRFTLVLTSDSMALRCGSFFMIAPSLARLFHSFFVFIEVIRFTLTRKIMVPLVDFSFAMRKFCHFRWEKKTVHTSWYSEISIFILFDMIEHHYLKHFTSNKAHSVGYFKG